MKKVKYCLILLLIISCTEQKLILYVKPGVIFSSTSTITVIGENDILDVQGQLEHILLIEGFEVVSELVARDTVKYLERTQEDFTGIKEKASITEKGRAIPAVYVLTFKYTYKTSVQENYFSTFSAQIISLYSGEIVASTETAFDESWDLGDIKDTLKELVHQLKFHWKPREIFLKQIKRHGSHFSFGLEVH